jgi:hypothetical protein
MRSRQALRGSLLTAVAICTTPAVARVEPVTLKELVSSSDMIVLATVTRVEDAPSGLKHGEGLPDRRPLRVATARVLEVWKGSPEPEVHYMASRSWVCDVTEANVGERAILFLSRCKGLPYLVIGHSGRGRMPLHEVGSVMFAVLPDQILLPKNTPVVSEWKSLDPKARPIDRKGPPPSPLTYHVESSIKLEILKKLVAADVR